MAIRAKLSPSWRTYILAIAIAILLGIYMATYFGL
jgi:hypothetical protein